jgi:cyclopropane-fatty-acyl-phospholipid synthase
MPYFPAGRTLFVDLLKTLIKQGQLGLIDADGNRFDFGQPPGRKVTVHLHDRNLPAKLFLRPRMMLGQAFMDGTLTIEDGSIYDFLMLAMINIEAAPPSIYSPLWGGVAWAIRRLHQYNPIARAKHNVAHHYDLSGTLYDLFLDADRQYSCGYFSQLDHDIDAAQADKKRHIAAKLRLKPGMKVLDIGSGWGGLAIYLAQIAGVDVTGLTLSEEQHKAATERAAAAGLADRVRFKLQDYREERGTYDRIVSVGMFEHVGLVHFRTFFDTLRARLADDGVALLHAIGRRDGPGDTNPWIRKYIFPGGYAPALSEVLPHIEKADLWVTDIEVLRLHYAETLRHWRLRFMANRDRAKALYDERFCRMWEFYLAASEATMRVAGQMVFQIQLARRIDAVPITRDYMIDWERAHQPTEMRTERLPVAQSDD